MTDDKTKAESLLSNEDIEQFSDEQTRIVGISSPNTTLSPAKEPTITVMPAQFPQSGPKPFDNPLDKPLDTQTYDKAKMNMPELKKLFEDQTRLSGNLHWGPLIYQLPKIHPIRQHWDATKEELFKQLAGLNSKVTVAVGPHFSLTWERKPRITFAVYSTIPNTLPPNLLNYVKTYVDMLWDFDLEVIVMPADTFEHHADTTLKAHGI